MDPGAVQPCRLFLQAEYRVRLALQTDGVSAEVAGRRSTSRPSIKTVGHARISIKEVAPGYRQICDLSHFDRSHAIGYAKDLRSPNRQGPQRFIAG